MVRSPIPVPRPAKRIRTADEPHSGLSFEGTSSQPPGPQVPLKRERSTSPPLERRLVTSGTKRFFPLPPDCLPSCPEYRRNREHWAARHVKELQALNLILERKMIRNIRDDGLIVDWRSVVPVWSDSLKPGTLDLAATITLTHQSNAQRPLPQINRRSPSNLKSVSGTPSKRSTPIVPGSRNVCDSNPTTKGKLPVPPRPSLIRRMAPSRTSPSAADLQPGEHRSSLSSRKRHSSNEIEVLDTSPSPPYRQIANLAGRQPGMTDFVSKQRPAEQSPLSKFCSQTGDQLTSRRGSSPVEEEMSEMTLDFLCRYVQTYEADRASLASAYARNASFAHRVHRTGHDSDLDESPSYTQQTSPCSAPKRTRLDIITALLTLPSLHSTRSAVAQIHYDMFYLGEELGMFVVCRAVIPGKTVVHNLILQKKEADSEDGGVEGVWPLVATAHQILVFEC